MFNDSIIHLCGAMELSVCVREGKDKRIMNLYLLVIHCKSVYDFILGRSFLASLDAMASTVHLKLKYHNDSRELVVILIDLRGAYLIQEIILKKPHAIKLIFEKKRKKTHTSYVATIDLDVQEAGILQDNELSSPPMTKAKDQRPFLEGNFNFV